MNTISGSIFGEIVCASESVATFAFGVAHRVVVHVRPDERLELEHAPHRLVGVADLDADGLVTCRPPHPHELALDRIRRRQIETVAREGGVESVRRSAYAAVSSSASAWISITQ